MAWLIQAEHVPQHTASLLPHSSMLLCTQINLLHYSINAASLQISYNLSEKPFDGWECLQQFFGAFKFCLSIFTQVFKVKSYLGAMTYTQDLDFKTFVTTCDKS